jgi:uncharacterized protein YndB with AHSA1/START domain
MSTQEQTQATTQVYRVYIKAAPQAVWDAITQPDWTAKYGFGGRMEYDLRPGGELRGYTSEAMKQGGVAQGIPVPDLAIVGEVIEADPPRKLVLSWHMQMDPSTATERHTRLTYEIAQTQPGVSKLTLVHDTTGAPQLAAILAGEFEAHGAGGGWAWILSDLKTLLETGHGFMA